MPKATASSTARRWVLTEIVSDSTRPSLTAAPTRCMSSSMLLASCPTASCKLDAPGQEKGNVHESKATPAMITTTYETATRCVVIIKSALVLCGTKMQGIASAEDITSIAKWHK